MGSPRRNFLETKINGSMAEGGGTLVSSIRWLMLTRGGAS